MVLPHKQKTLTPGNAVTALGFKELGLRLYGWTIWKCEEFSNKTASALLSVCLPHSNYTALVGVWIYGFFVMVLLALDFLYYSAINYELCRIYLDKWGLGGRWLKKARNQWNQSMPEESEVQAQAQPMVPSHHQPRHSLRGESHSPTLLPYNTSTAWWGALPHRTPL